MSNSVRTRFAPSPTGYMHVGGVRTALFAWLLARQSNGQFILRLEDTDQKREVSGAAEHLMGSLKALGLNYDEGPDKDGDFGPYRQSERLEIYKEWASKLIESGRAYSDPYTPQEVQAFREQAQKEKRPFLYRNHRPDSPPAWNSSQPLRFLSEPKAYKWQDEVMGELSTGPEVVDDFILIKSDGFPTYNFAHIIDDMLMQISHVIRGQEFLASVPNYLNLYEALEIDHPVFATMPHILGPDGNKKLSKRDGAKDVLDYIEEGYLPEAMLNFIATLGWNDGTEQEVFTVDELIEKFSLGRVQKGGARFDERRLQWINGAHIRSLILDDLYERAEGYWPPSAEKASEDYKKQVLSLVQERLKYLSELPELTDFFFKDLAVNTELIESHKKLKKYDAILLKNMLSTTNEALEEADFSSSEKLQETLNTLLEKTEEKPVVLFSLIRIATTWSAASPGLAETLHVLGKETVLRRINESQSALA